MEEKNNKCSNKEHKDINAISFCKICKIYICNDCSKHHQELFPEHKVNTLNNNKDISIAICQEKNHTNKLEFYCRKHNQLCCVACISRIKTNEYGQHKDCDVCILQDIQEEKKIILKDNIKYLEDLSYKLNNHNNELKTLMDNIKERKEQLKLNIQNFFTKIKMVLKEREDELLLEVDNKYKEIFGDEKIIKEIENLPNKIELLLVEGKTINNDWIDNNKLSSIINNCINIENDIKNMKILNEHIKNYKINNVLKIEFDIKKENFDNLIKSIKSFGNINDQSENKTKIEEKIKVTIKPKYIIDIPNEIKNNLNFCSFYFTLKNNYLDKKQILNISTSNPFLYKTFDGNMKYLLDSKKNYVSKKAEEIELLFNNYLNLNEYLTKEISLTKKSISSLSLFKKKEEEDILQNDELPDEVGSILKFLYYLLDETFEENMNNKQLFENMLTNIVKKNEDKTFIGLLANYIKKNKFLNLTKEKVDNINKIITEKAYILNMIKLAKISRPFSLFCFALKEVYDYINLKTPDGHYYYEFREKNEQLQKYKDFINLYENNGRLQK